MARGTTLAQRELYSLKGSHADDRRHWRARIVVSETATVEGTLSAPAISVAEGAVLHGRVEAEGRPGAALQLAS